ncbi:hypothetical protein [Marinimicrobium sp. ABcell2]|uniref:hypothetical protein n=1 Tax=Marinimicrobium sp. ABcell2 TaxID=3069751 RepID=UPI0027AF1F0A|nr:hypothetical protein [Marinimicrobium sp. ABcell2]MDQ2077378.1 hypothetical protein [Marinimicrobium sp. ABcell2]
MKDAQTDPNIHTPSVLLLSGRTFLALALVNILTFMVLLNTSASASVVYAAKLAAVVCCWLGLGAIPSTRGLDCRLFLTVALMTTLAFMVPLSSGAPTGFVYAVGAMATIALWVGLGAMPFSQRAEEDISRPKRWVERTLLVLPIVAVVSFGTMEAVNMSSAPRSAVEHTSLEPSEMQSGPRVQSISTSEITDKMSQDEKEVLSRQLNAISRHIVDLRGPSSSGHPLGSIEVMPGGGVTTFTGWVPYANRVVNRREGAENAKHREAMSQLRISEDGSHFISEVAGPIFAESTGEWEYEIHAPEVKLHIMYRY